MHVGRVGASGVEVLSYLSQFLEGQALVIDLLAVHGHGLRHIVDAALINSLAEDLLHGSVLVKLDAVGGARHQKTTFR